MRKKEEELGVSFSRLVFCNALLIILYVIGFASSAKTSEGDPQGSVPVYKASLLTSNPTTTTYAFSTPCFENYTLTFSSTTEEGLILLEIAKPLSLICEDVILFADLQELHIHRFALPGKHELKIRWKEGEYQQVVDGGLQVFLVKDGILGELSDLWEFYRLMTKDEDASFVMKFLEENSGWQFIKRPQQTIYLNASQILNGDYLAVFNLDGASLLITYGTGSHTDHTAVAMWIDDQLYVVESTGGPGVQRTLWDDYVYKQPPEYHIALLRLHPYYQSRFNVTAALGWFEKVEGLPYGYVNFVFGWIDTAMNNYPPPLSEEVIPIAMSLVERIQPKWSIFYMDGINKRLNTNLSNIEQVFAILDERNITFAQLMTQVEQDSWVYGSGPAMVCSTFVMNLYRAAGLFKENETFVFEAAEFTPKDTYQIQIFDPNWERPSACLVDETIPYCQLTGEYLLELPGFNSIPLYPNMNDFCGALPPLYQRSPSNC